ncbi:unnamed protein product, partial [Prorocentrum cordatum]
RPRGGRKVPRPAGGGGRRVMADDSSELLTTKNTFLDCQSPWMEPVVLPQRPSSDPGASTDSMTSVHTAQSVSSVVAPTKQSDSLQGAASRARDRAGAPACAAGPTAGGRDGEAAAFVPISKTRRRRNQRKERSFP